MLFAPMDDDRSCLYYTSSLERASLFSSFHAPLLKIEQRFYRGVYYQNNLYFCPSPLFSKVIYFPQVQWKFFVYPCFFLLPLIFAFFLNKLSYFFPKQPITYIFAPQGGNMKNIHPCNGNRNKANLGS